MFGDVEVGAVGRCEGWFDFGGGGAEGGLLFGDGLVGEVGVFCLLFFHVCLVLYCIVGCGGCVVVELCRRRRLKRSSEQRFG